MEETPEEAKDEVRFTIGEDRVGQRLDIVCAETMPEVTRSQIKKMIEEESITVNYEKSKGGYWLRLGDIVVAHPRVKKSRPADPNLVPLVIEETDDYIVLNKPSGLLVHPTAYTFGGTLVDWLIARDPKFGKVGDDPQRPGIVHRLDKDASGVMVVAKTQDFFEHLKRQFKTRTVTKQYLVVASGIMPRPEGVIALPIGYAKHQYGRMAAGTKGEKQALTEYFVQEQGGKYALVLVEPKTGRTHQIRVHFFGAGHALAGDPLYKGRNMAKNEASRLMLHAYRVAFTDLAGVRKDFTCPADASFMQAVDKLIAIR